MTQSLTRSGSMLASIFNSKEICFLSVLIIATASACQSNKTDGSHKPKQTMGQANDTLRYEEKSIKELSPYFAERDGDIDTTYVEVSYPSFIDSGMNKIVNENILLEGEENLNQYIDNFLEGYGNFVEENIVEYPLAWYKVTHIKVELNSPQIVMLKNFTYEFSGGAHGNSFELWNVYDVQNYRKLPLNTFISENKMKEFTKIAEKFFRAEEGLSDTSSLENGYFFENDTFALPANYGISTEGIVFHYNPYEIKPYAAGTTTITIPYEEIQDCMTQTGKNYINKVKKYFNSIQ